jgi:hypothetical protein
MTMLEHEWEQLKRKNRIEKFEKETDPAELEKIKKMANLIRKSILSKSEMFRINTRFCKLEHHDGVIKLTRWADTSEYTRTKHSVNINVACNGGALDRKKLWAQVMQFVTECYQKNLCIQHFVDLTANDEKKEE